jgi:hypothetical protein
MISIQPSYSQPQAIPPQICPVILNNAVITNPSEDIWLVKKKSTFLAVPSKNVDHVSSDPGCTHPSQPRLLPPPRAPDPLPNISVNKSVLSPQQIQRLQQIHEKNSAAFNSDLTTGYNHTSGKYFANLRFKEDSKPEAKTLDVPQYNRQCASLQQALMDRLEHQNVLVNPHDHGIEVRSVSPSWVIQKGSAKSKSLRDCTIDELRWVVAFNNLNSHLLPKPAKISSLGKALKFLARWKYHIFADLHNSYFQIHVAKKYWCWLGVMTPYRGLRVLTRLGQGLLNSEGELDELLAIVLGDLLTQGICEIARDDIQVGGNTYEEAISNWDLVLTTLAKNGLKLSPRKVRIFPTSTEIYGVKLENGKLTPSDHVLTTLGLTSISQLKTTRDVNAWRGLYKTLLHNLPKLAAFMHPFDIATASKAPKDTFTWSPELTAAFNAAQDHLKNSRPLALPAPHEQLVLQPDGAQRPPSIGWVLSVIRTTNNKSQLVPVQYCSAKLKPHMQFWSPCEIEAVATNIAVEQCAPWIMEAQQPTFVCPDSKAVVQAAHRMAMGKMSTNPRLQNLLASINRRPITFHHSSAKLGQHILSDACSRTDTTCKTQDCSIERFLDDLPDKVELMATCCPISSLEQFVFPDVNCAFVAACGSELIALLSSPSSMLPLGSLDTWRAIQEGDPDTAVVLHCKKSGDTPRKRSTNPTINRFFSNTVVKDGVLVAPQLDTKTMRNINRVAVPPSYLPTLLTIIHMKCNHPSRYQMDQVFHRYFFAPPGLDAQLSKLYEQCFTCQSLRKFKQPTDFAPPTSPDHPGTHFQSDIIKHERQLIMVTTDLFSNYTTTCFIQSEQKEDLIGGLIQTTTPVRRAETISIRTDCAPAFRALSRNPSVELLQAGIAVILPDTDHNKNSNAKVDKIIQELQTEIRKLVPLSKPLSNADLAKSTSLLNNRIRKAGFSAGEIQFARDLGDGTNLTLSDPQIKEANITGRPRLPGPDTIPPAPGDLVLLKTPGTKMSPNQPLMVTSSGPRTSSLRKILHSQPHSNSPIKISPFPLTIKNSDLAPIPPLIPSTHHTTRPNPFHFGPEENIHQMPPPPPHPTPPSWHPFQSLPSDSESDDFDTSEPSPPLTSNPPNLPLLIQSDLISQVRHAASLPTVDSIIPHISRLFESSRLLAQATHRPSPPAPPAPQHPPRPPSPTIQSPDNPTSPILQNLPPRKAKLVAQAALSTSRIPQLEGAETTPLTTPDKSYSHPHHTPPSTSPARDHHLSPLEPWSPTSLTREPSLEWDPENEAPSFNLFPDDPTSPLPGIYQPFSLDLPSPQLEHGRVYNVNAWLPRLPNEEPPDYWLNSANVQHNRVYNLSAILPIPADPQPLPSAHHRWPALRRLLRRLRHRSQ